MDDIYTQTNQQESMILIVAKIYIW